MNAQEEQELFDLLRRQTAMIQDLGNMLIKIAVLGFALAFVFFFIIVLGIFFM